MRCRVKGYAKINLSLNIVGERANYHELDSVVVTIDLYDTITVSKRKDDKINLIMRGIGEDCISPTQNNAYKSALLFKETFKTKGVDILIEKRIPLSGGLGGSSADIAGVLNALKKLFAIEEDVKPLADKLGSDSGYLLSGGFARISGRGEIVENIKDCKNFPVLLIYSESGVNTADCFKEYDLNKTSVKPSNNEKLIDALKTGDIKEIAREVGNDLALPAEKLCVEIGKNLNALKSLSPLCASVSGSGATVFGLFETEELTHWAADKLQKQGLNAEVVYTVIPK